MSLSGAIVLVEDDEDDIFLIRAALDELKVANSVEVFRNGLDALSYLETQNDVPFLIVSDLNMPVMNGFELLNALLQRSFFNGNVPPFVFLTTSETSAIPQHSFDRQRFTFFTKGYSYDQILDTVSVIVKYSKSVHTPAG